MTVIIVTYNAGIFIDATLKRLSDQRFTDYEVVFIDGGSNDNTLSVIESYRPAFKESHVVSEKDRGIYDAMNKGIALAQGKYIYFLNAGDLLYDDSVFLRVVSALDGKSVYY